MGNTHTKLLAGAFSVLSVMQFFMVYDLNRQLDQFVEVASVVTVRPFPFHRLRTAAPARNADRRVNSQLNAINSNLPDVVENRNINGGRIPAGEIEDQKPDCTWVVTTRGPRCLTGTDTSRFTPTGIQ